MASEVSNSNSIAYEFGSNKGATNEVRRLARTKKKKKVLLQKLIELDVKHSGKVNLADFY